MIKKISLLFPAFLLVLSLILITPSASAQEGWTADDNDGPTYSGQAVNGGTPQQSDNWLSQIGIPGGQIIPPECTKSYTRSELNGQPIVKKCGLNSIFQLIINFSTLILGLSGTAVMLMIVYGGTMFILAAGQADRVTKAKEILKSAVLGLIVILFSWIIVNAIILTLTKGEVGSKAALFGQSFDQQQKVELNTQTTPPLSPQTQCESSCNRSGSSTEYFDCIKNCQTQNQ